MIIAGEPLTMLDDSERRVVLIRKHGKNEIHHNVDLRLEKTRAAYLVSQQAVEKTEELVKRIWIGLFEQSRCVFGGQVIFHPRLHVVEWCFPHLLVLIYVI